MVKTLDRIDLSNPKIVQGYEDLLRKRLKRFGYCLSKRKTTLNHNCIELRRGVRKRGFRITELDSGAIVSGKNFELTLSDVEQFWSKEYEKWHIKRREDKDRKYREKLAAQKRPKTIKILDRWTITNDDRAVRALNDHISQYGEFDADGNGAEGTIAAVVYKAYRPYCCPDYNRVWPIDGDWSNLTDVNLRSDADETTLSDGVVPVTTQRRIWHNGRRIFIKLALHDQLFFTVYTPELFQILSDKKALNGWYLQEQIRNAKILYRLYCRVCGKIVSMAEVVALYDKGKIALDNITGSVLAGKQWLRDNGLQVDHLRNNVTNNCPHSLAVMPQKINSGKSDIVTEIMLPYVFIPVRIGESFRVLCGKARYDAETDDFDMSILKMITCDAVDKFYKLLTDFKKVANQNGDMLSRPDDRTVTNCVVQMFADDGLEFHGTYFNPTERLLRASDSDLIPYYDNIVEVLL